MVPLTMGFERRTSDVAPLTAGQFTTTHWSVVLAAKDEDSPRAKTALDRLCRTYWPPLYAFIRKEGYPVEEAQDLTQEFLSRLVHKQWLSHLEHQRGKFRSFLLTFLKYFLSDARDRAGAAKRGGGQTVVSLDACEMEERECLEPADRLTPDQAFERRWAQTLLRSAVDRLREEYAQQDKAALFDHLKELQPGAHGERTLAEVGAQFGMSESAIKSASHRLRLRHREILREEIAHTVGDAADVDGEIRHMISVLSR